jgi:hypothetical protein
MTKEKSLAQIAYEAHAKHYNFVFPWDDAGDALQATYRDLAAAVARAVRRREQGKKP